MTKTQLGYFGGAKIPTVTIFGVGFQAGMENIMKSTAPMSYWSVGTTPGEAGLFTGDFADLTKGKDH
jgi:basic membrane lipoprotein Med (substrate-binding protein (PBP1-ABC) superfamily)